MQEQHHHKNSCGSQRGKCCRILRGLKNYPNLRSTRKRITKADKSAKPGKIQKRKVANSLELSIKDRTAEELKVTKLANKRVLLFVVIVVVVVVVAKCVRVCVVNCVCVQVYVCIAVWYKLCISIAFAWQN